MKQPIELRRVRDFGEIINDTFTFLKENFKPLFKALFIICGFFVLAGAATTALTQLKLVGLTTTKFNPDTYDSATTAYSYAITVIVNALILVFAQLSIYLVTLCYIAVYLERKDRQPTFAEVWGFFKYYFWRALGSSVLMVLLMFVGFLLCIIPGIYLMPPLYLLFPIIVMENTSFSYAFNKSFTLVKDNWWTVFGVIVIMSIIVSVLGAFINVPMSLILTTRSFVSLKSFNTPIVIFFSIMRNVLMLAYTLPAIALTMCYFSLSEQKDGTGILGRIDTFGKGTDNSNDLPAEQY
ncbi:hypothetical protein [Mucilaginibacter sp.]|uniref:hypothetical protein n=1 Tax=Mucilaginibacter sp. TaxID=1882438 RepID=UPI0025D57A89|nr:hypothetical protein [Mucilaginibacter sp.]